MAKAKKPATGANAQASKSKSKKSAQAAPASPAIPAIDPTHAMNTAAAMVAGGAAQGIKAADSQKESSAFKQMKEGLSKGSTMSSALNKTGGPIGKKSNQPFAGFNRQVGHNQTFGADVNRSGVPRRTGGG